MRSSRRAVGRGGWLRGLAPPPQPKKRERGEEERKNEERGKEEKRNQKRNEVEPVIARTCGHRPLAAPRPPADL